MKAFLIRSVPCLSFIFLLACSYQPSDLNELGSLNPSSLPQAIQTGQHRLILLGDDQGKQVALLHLLDQPNWGCVGYRLALYPLRAPYSPSKNARTFEKVGDHDDCQENSFQTLKSLKKILGPNILSLLLEYGFSNPFKSMPRLADPCQIPIWLESEGCFQLKPMHPIDQESIHDLTLTFNDHSLLSMPFIEEKWGKLASVQLLGWFKQRRQPLDQAFLFFLYEERWHTSDPAQSQPESVRYVLLPIAVIEILNWFQPHPIVPSDSRHAL